MKSSIQQKRTFMTRFMMKVVLVVISTALIVYFMPRGDEFGYKYELDRPWNYGLLIANTKFPILKNDSLIHQEKETMMRSFQPYYNYNKAVRDTMMNRLYNYAAKEWQGQNSTLYVHHIAVLLDTIYQRGVLSGEDYARLKDKEHHKNIRVVRNNEAVSVPLSRVFSLRSAYDYIIAEDTAKYSRLVLRQYNINELIQQNLAYDQMKSETELDENLQNISSYNGFVQAGQKIVDRGETVTDEVYDILRSYERDYERRNTIDTKIPYRSIGQSIFVLVIFVSLITYLSLFRIDYFENTRSVTLLFALPVFFCVIASLMVSHKVLNVFMLPCCLVPIVIRVFMDSRTAFMFHCGMVLIISMMLTNNYEFIIVQLVAGMVAIQTLRELSQRSQIVRTAFIIFLVYVIFYTGYSLHHENDIKMDTWMYICFTVNCVLLLFTYPLLWMLEKVFGFTSDVTLVELSNVHNPLFQRMTEVAPGTFQHSMQVANLSAEVANKIGAKAQLVRTGALYHDIGKMERPAFFTENQNGLSPHKHLTPLKSAEVIIAHVKNGLALADKNHIPDSIKRFITTHHGLGKAKYFYITYKNEHPDEDIDESAFAYPGPNPSTKEEAILMMCDAVEAASRSLPEYTEESINQLVDKIIDNQVAEGFFSVCSITFKDIAIAKNVLKDKLKTIYHTRISYPEMGEDYENREEK
ncbi:MAG: HDIG domain-containing protein [Bacteroidaceae bacterium]|nr:HDIG domain-containing protein [Bacteroidaceae bacterium]